MKNLSSLMSADLSNMLAPDHYMGGHEDSSVAVANDGGSSEGEEEFDPVLEEGKRSWGVESDKLKSVMERARMSLANVENRAVRAMTHVRQMIDAEMVDGRAARALAHARRIIDTEVDRMVSLQLYRSDVDAMKTGLKFLNPPSHESTFEAATRVVDWLRKEAEVLANGFSDSDESEDEFSDDVSLRLFAQEKRNERRATLSVVDRRALHRIYVLVGDVLQLARASLVCRAWHQQLHRERSGRSVWKWTCRFGTIPPSGTCPGFWLVLGREATNAAYRLSTASFDELDISSISVAIPDNAVRWLQGFDENGPNRRLRVDPDGVWKSQIAVDAARTPITRLWHGIPVPQHENMTFDQAPPDVIEPHRQTIALICGHVAATHPRLGYCQGIDYVVAYAMRASCLDAHDATLLVTSLLDGLELAALFEPGLPGLKKRCLELGLLLEARCPVLSRHLAANGVQFELFAASWIQTLFVYVDALPIEVVDRVWTLLLFERSWKPMHRLSIAIFSMLEPHILRRSTHDILLFVSQLTTTSADRPKRLLQQQRDYEMARRVPSSSSLDKENDPKEEDDDDVVENHNRSQSHSAYDYEDTVPPVVDASALLAGPDNRGRELLRCAMNIKVTNSMLARIGANEALPKPLRARVSADAKQHHDD